MRQFRFAALAVALAMTACGQPSQPAETSDTQTSAEDSATEPAPPQLPPVDPELLAAPNTAFTAIEPSEVGVFGAPNVMQALEPLLGPEVSEGATLSVSIRESGEMTTADVVRSGLSDDSVSAGQVRLEFSREPDGWYPVNAYRRSMCARGANAGQWTTEPCP